MKIQLEILALLSPSGFEKRFHKHCKETKTYSEALELLKTGKLETILQCRKDRKSYYCFAIIMRSFLWDY